MSYLDHHASAPMVPAARDAMAQALGEMHGNPSSVHALGRAARARIEVARRTLAASVGAAPLELVFTSGGTEAVALAVRGVGAGVGSVLVDPGAHPALRAACEQLAGERGVPCVALPCGAEGALGDGALAAVTSQRERGECLVALSLAQHETGALHEAAMVRALAATGALVVLDAVQALGRCALDLGALGVASAAFSAHKIGGPTGAGAAWLSGARRARGLLEGGSQERGLRAGTENLLGIVGFGAAAGALSERLAAMRSIAARRDRLERALTAERGVVCNGATRPRVATATHVSVREVAGEELVAAFDLEGVCVSSGPACSSGRPGASASMLALYPDEPWRAHSALRVSLGPETTDAEIEHFVSLVPSLLARLRGVR